MPITISEMTLVPKSSVVPTSSPGVGLTEHVVDLRLFAPGVVAQHEPGDHRRTTPAIEQRCHSPQRRRGLPRPASKSPRAVTERGLTRRERATPSRQRPEQAGRDPGQDTSASQNIADSAQPRHPRSRSAARWHRGPTGSDDRSSGCGCRSRSLAFSRLARVTRIDACSYRARTLDHRQIGTGAAHRRSARTPRARRRRRTSAR